MLGGPDSLESKVCTFIPTACGNVDFHLSISFGSNKLLVCLNVLDDTIGRNFCWSGKNRQGWLAFLACHNIIKSGWIVLKKVADSLANTEIRAFNAGRNTLCLCTFAYLTHMLTEYSL